MQLKILACSLAPLFVASLAHADGPDEAPSALVARSVMENRWSLGLSLGSMGLTPDHTHDAQTSFTAAELALRFRATPHLELALASGGGQESHDHSNGPQFNSVMLAARYRFMPEAAWNWFVTGGFGAAALASQDATDQQRQDALQPIGMLGVGVERRFEHFALQAELRGISLGKRTTTTTVDAPVMTTPAAMATTTTTTTVPAQSGGSLTVGLSYYF
ncbi:MAG TPA: hypothetical protein VHW23_05985 [Kofleriaceae bacterium]|jgi:hypothetical protein|nr:hypothetical protein [Kofleriaceae bacterium]